MENKSHIEMMSSDDDKSNNNSIVINDNDQNEENQFLSPKLQEKNYESIHSHQRHKNNKYGKVYTSFQFHLPCIFFIAGVVFNTIAISFLSMRVSNPKNLTFGLTIGACLGIFISMAVIGIILMTIGYTLLEQRHIASERSNRMNSNLSSTCNKKFALFMMGAILNTTAITFLCLRIANPQEFGLGLKASTHLGIFTTMAFIGLAVSGIGYLLLKKSLKDLSYQRIQNTQENTDDDSLFDPQKPTPMRTTSISPIKSDNINKENDDTSNKTGVIFTMLNSRK